MTVRIINQTADNSLRIAVNSEVLWLEKEQSVSITVKQPHANISVIPSDNNSVLFNWFFAKIDGYFSAEHVVNSLVCDAGAVIDIIGEDAVVVLKDLRHRDDKEGYIYDSVYFDCHSCHVYGIEYRLKEFLSAKKKARRLYVLLCSMLPLLLVDFGLLLWFKDAWFIVAMLVLLLFFSIPSFKRAARIKMFYNDMYANKVLHDESELMRIHNGEEATHEPTGFFERTLYKVFDFVFKSRK